MRYSSRNYECMHADIGSCDAGRGGHRGAANVGGSVGASAAVARTHDGIGDAHAADVAIISRSRAGAAVPNAG